MSELDKLIDETITTLQTLRYKIFLAVGKKNPFDLIAKRDKTILILKFLTNIDGLKDDQARSLRNVAGELNASAIIVGLRTKGGNLLDDVVYERYGLVAVNPNTLINSLTGKMPDKVYNRGRLIARLDNNQLSSLLDQEDINTITELLGVSRASVSQYKKGEINIDYNKAVKLRDVFNIELDRYNILKPPKPEKAKMTGYLSDLEKMGFDVIPVYKGFDAVAKAKENVIAARPDVIGNKNIAKFRGVSEFLGSHPMLVSDKPHDSMDGVAVVKKDEIKKTKSAKDLIKIIKERED